MGQCKVRFPEHRCALYTHTFICYSVWEGVATLNNNRVGEDIRSAGTARVDHGLSIICIRNIGSPINAASEKLLNMFNQLNVS